MEEYYDPGYVEYYDDPGYVEYPAHPAHSEKQETRKKRGFPWTKFLIITAVVIVIIVVLLYFLAIGWTKIAPGLFSTTYDVPILDVMNYVSLENADPPDFVNHFNTIPYTFEVNTYDEGTGTGTGTLAWREDLGLNEGVAVASGNFTVTNSGTGMTFENFTYITYIGREVSNMPQGPFYFTLISVEPRIVELTGHYAGITETLELL
jgi:hypothetical protein